MKKLRMLAAICAGALMFGACANTPPADSISATDDNTSSQEPAAPGTDGNAEVSDAAFLCPMSIGNPFVALVYNGIKQATDEQGADIKVLENVEKDVFEAQVREMAKLGYNPVVVIWDDPADAVMNVAKDFPETKFIVGDCFKVSDDSNVMTVAVEPFESAFIAGYVAAKSTQSGQIAFAGSIDGPNINNFKNGYIAGANYANPEVKVESAYIGTNKDPAKGKEVAIQLANGGADIIMQAADEGGLGVIQGCAEAGIRAIGVDDWQGDVSDAVMWSALKNITQAMYNATASVYNDTFESGLKKYTASDDIALYDQRDFDKLPEELQAEVLSVLEDIKSGKIDVIKLVEEIA